MKRIHHKLLWTIAVWAIFIFPLRVNLKAPIHGISYESSFSVLEVTHANSDIPSKPSQTVLNNASSSYISPLEGITNSDESILSEARDLAEKDGVRPKWTQSQFKSGEKVPDGVVQDVLAHLIPCENYDRLMKSDSKPKVLDTNGYYSYGLLQIQMATWIKWSIASGITGDPRNAHDAIAMAKYAIKNGDLNAWSCSTLTGMIK